MNKKKKPSPAVLQLSETALRQVAAANGVTVEEVRKQIKLAMLNGMLNGQMNVVPAAGDVPTPEGVVAYGVEKAMEKGK